MTFGLKIFLLTAISCLSACRYGPNTDDLSVSSHSHVVGGREAPQHAYPFMVSIFGESSRQTICGGSLIAPKVVLTAAHCLSEVWFPASKYSIRIGKHNMIQKEDSEETIKIAKIVTHPDFSAGDRGFKNDIALIFLREKSKFAPIKLNRNHALPESGSMLRVIGWGFIHEEAFYIPQNTLLEVDLPVVDNETCRGLNREFDIQESQLCAGYLDGNTKKDACNGDSGGPLFSPDGERFLFGIISGGSGCARPKLPAFYTRVSHYVDWIERKIGPLP
ncbi:MAG: serine protease [Oligoflexales bacterium]|nr:serine protease [Oligoflexales bacterium]